MASSEEPNEEAPATTFPQIHMVQELLPSVHDLLLLKEKMLANGFSSGQGDAPQFLGEVAETVVGKSGKSEASGKMSSSEDRGNNRSNGGIKEGQEEARKDRKDKKRLGSRTTAPLEISSSDSSWVSETEEPLNNPSRGRSKNRGAAHTNGVPPTTPEKVLKLSPTRLGELLRDTPTPFSLHPSSQSQPPLMVSPSITSPTRHRSTTNPSTNTSPVSLKNSPFMRPQLSTQDRTLSAPAGMKRSKSFPRVLHLNTQTSPPRVPQIQLQQQGKPMEIGGDSVSPQETTAPTSKTPQSSGTDSPTTHLSPKSAISLSSRNNAHSRRDSNPPPSAHLPTTTHLLKSATPTPSSFPPLPLQTYLSLALASPTSHTSPATFTSSQKLGPIPSTNTHNLPQHDPDDSAAIAFERITNFLILPVKLEGTLWFGMLACLDSWLYMFTILPLRFVRALGVLCAFWCGGIKSSLSWGSKMPKPRRMSSSTGKSEGSAPDKPKNPPISTKGKSAKRVSDLQPSHKADILRGLVVFTSCWILMRFDASRMYHSIKGQNGIKLYVIYNMLEISDRLCSALGQDIFECLFSKETLERGPDGRSKVLRPLGFFLLALAYNTLHSTTLFYQVITLNVAVNSYSNALLTLLLSVQFVEIKSTVFKKFEKESLFQLTCADVVERFQLWLMLVIIASRNLVEIGVWSLSGIESGSGGGSSASILPKSFTIFPEWTGQVMGPFLLVLGSEMLVDWLKHAYITKFNNTRPAVYERFLDVLCKDYYSHAFTDQNLTKRLGLPVIPLACLFIRASLQTYQMFLATHVSLPLPSATTSLSESNASPVTTVALANIDAILRRALGHSPFGGSMDPASESSSDNFIAVAMLFIFFLGFFLVFLAVKLVLGICLLTFARKHYKGMKERAGMNFLTGARKVGGFGLIEVSDDQKKWIYADDPVGERALKERESRPPPREVNLDDVKRYSMAAKRIW